jgi:hypothetical protein
VIATLTGKAVAGVRSTFLSSIATGLVQAGILHRTLNDAVAYDRNTQGPELPWFARLGNDQLDVWHPQVK